MDDALGDGFSSKSGCFRHQVLLCRQRHWHVIDSWREHGFAECVHDSHRFQKIIADEKISLSASRRLVSPVCIAGVLTSLPNFSAL
jgi:hypothetical protein